MNKIEKAVYDILKSNPKIKLFVRNIYQYLFDLIPDKDNYFKYPDVRVKENYFFGFHDLCPFSDDDRFVLANRINIPLHMPDNDEVLTVGFWDLEMNQYVVIGESYAWNYHKGCRLQWLGEGNRRIIYNSAKREKLCASIFNLDSSITTSIDYPIDSSSPDGKHATSFSYERLNKCMPGYGYNYYEYNSCLEDNSPSETGLFIVDVEHNSREMILSLEQLSLLEPDKTMENAIHFVTHTEFSPDGNKVAFLHRWTFKDDYFKRYSRLVTCNLDGSDIHISRTSGMVSHYVWDEKHGILAYCQVDGIDGHYVFDSYRLDNCKRVATSLNSDGHQSYVNGTDAFITDTYPDRRRYAKLYYVDINDDKIEKIAEVKSYKEFQTRNVNKHWACDLHPRVSKSGKYICFDTVHTRKRSLAIMTINNI